MVNSKIRRIVAAAIMVTVGVVAPTVVPCAEGCTSAVVGRSAARYGRAMLWKHRDSGHPDNFVGRVAATDSTMAYVALYNAGDTEQREAWIGFNSAGFAVMNTASYNMAPDTAAIKDCEGLLMSEALATCHTVADFEKLLQRKIGSKPLGVQANFGVIDANGAGAYFETTDYAYKQYPLEAATDELLVRSNYSYCGGDAGKLGVVRHDTACRYLAPLAASGDIEPESFTEQLSRSFYHSGHQRDMAVGNHLLVDRGEYIPRRSSCASVVIESAKAGEDASYSTVMWIAIGFPTASSVECVTLDSIPADLCSDAVTGRSAKCDEVNNRRQQAFPRKGKEGKWLINVDYLRSIDAQCRRESVLNYEEGRKRRNLITQ